jgi:hypothetical protein
MSGPDREENIFVGRGASADDEYLTLALANRHSLATGAGKTEEFPAIFWDLFMLGVFEKVNQ